MRKDRNRTPKRNRKEMIVDSLKLPKDIMMGASIVTLTGSYEA